MNVRNTAIAILTLGIFVLIVQPLWAKETEDCQLSPVEIYERYAETIIQVVSFGIDQHRVAGRVRPGTGSGIILEPGVVLTNYHVVQGASLLAIVADEQTYVGELIGGDPALDVALVAVPYLNAPPDFLSPGSYYDLKVGETAYVLGFPLGIGRTLTSGIISGLDRKLPLNTISWTTRYIQTDAPISAGNSGGALLDDCGRLIGMVSLASMDPMAENIGYALPTDTILPLVAEIAETGRVSRPWHGLYGQMTSPLVAQLMAMDPSMLPLGFLVETVEPGSAADQAGIRGGFLPVMWGNAEILLGGDVITEVNGRPIRSLEEALGVVQSIEIGQTVHLKIWREGVQIDLSAEINERPDKDTDLWVSMPR